MAEAIKEDLGHKAPGWTGGRRGHLRLTVESLQFRPKGSYDELAVAAPVDIPLLQIVRVSPSGRFFKYPWWMHIILFPLPLLLMGLQRLMAAVGLRTWFIIRTTTDRYYFYVRGKRDEWIEAINEQRAAIGQR